MRRREYLTYSVAGALAATSGCLRLSGGSGTPTAESDITDASFTFAYRPDAGRVVITYDGGTALQAGDITIETVSGTAVAWPELGTTVEAPDDALSAGNSAEIGAGVLNWETPVSPSDTVRVVYEREGAPTTISRFSPGATEVPEPTDTPESTEYEGPASSDAELVVHHTYDGNLADSANSVDGVGAGRGLTVASSDGDTALVFAGDGAGDGGSYYDIPDDGLTEVLSPGSSFSVSLWMRPRQLDGWEMILNGDGLVVDLRYGSLRIRWYQDGSSVYRRTVPVDEALAVGEWTHVAAVVDAGREVRPYVDGAALAPVDIPSEFGFRPYTKADGVRLGFHPRADDGAFDSHYNGAVDSLRYYRGTLAAGAVEDLSRER